MIWSCGELIADDALSVSVFDRTFEHGLGLFETFRTWEGHVTLLDRHLARLEGSARELGLPLEPEHLPDRGAVARLIAANREIIPPGTDARLRITLSGGMATAPPSGSLLWMTAGPLPPSHRDDGVIINHSFHVAADDPVARHKTLNYWRKRMAHGAAVSVGSDESLCVTHDGLICEASRSNIFLIEGRRLCTPSLDGPTLPGIMRGLVLERAFRVGLQVGEVSISTARIQHADEAFLTNSVRGVVPIGVLMGVELPAPGPKTRQLWNDILPWLESAGSTP
jgi:branched-subunit amino acid aminotransferase/4-amino-4-deoxychorismate lyase